MACGLVPVVSRIPANLPWIDDGRNGLLFEPGRPDQLADALRRAIFDSELRARAAVENRDRVTRDGNMATNLRRMSELLRSAAGLSRRGAA
jgi:glycosyltransferase involved in cell wall biosynthesis